MNYIPCMLTIGIFICGLLAIHSLLYHNIHSAVLFNFTGMLLVLFYGMSARKLNAVSEMGKEMDSIA
ncbi:CDP-alcohol phosphatidyltransferase family protein, partial [Bacillus vallismortis]|nr:CDP-alcohol phosphatidyltransferase family protein [Bacillus vallismortis]